MHRYSFGVLKTCFGESDLELYCESLPLTVDGWEKDHLISLREAAKKLNPINDFDVSHWNCKSRCQYQRCACCSKRSPCTSKCHQGTTYLNFPQSPCITITYQESSELASITDAKPAKRSKVQMYIQYIGLQSKVHVIDIIFTLMCLLKQYSLMPS